MENKLIFAIQEAITTDKCFLDKKITLYKMSVLLDTNTSYLSKVINSTYGKRFSDFINRERIKHLLFLIAENPKIRTYTVEHLASLSGFQSASAFYNAFKKYTGTTPAKYIKKLNGRHYFC